MSEHIAFERRGHVGIITFTRTEAHNALNNDMLNSLARVLSDVETEHDIRALMITGSGDAFSSGVDLVELEADHQDVSHELVRKHLQSIQGLTRHLMQLPIPTVAALNGLAVGMGSELSLSCDIRLASDQAYLWFSEARRGLFQSNGVLFLLPRLIGHSRAMEWMLSARRIPASELFASGLVSHLYPHDEFRERAIEYVEEVASHSPLSLRLLKQTGFRAMEATFEEVLEMEIQGMQSCIESDYMVEGLNAYLEKREPRF